MEEIQVMIIDKHPLFRTGICAVLERAGGHVIASESTVYSKIERICVSASPDVAIIGDLVSSNTEALEIARLVRHLRPTIAIIFLTEREDEEHLFQAIKIGAAAYAFRTITKEDLVETVRKVSSGEYLISDAIFSKPRVASRVLQSFREPKEMKTGARIFSPLSGRELEILDYISRGSSNKEIAKALKISDQTVKNHITSVLRKLSVNDRTAAVVRALKYGWLEWEK